jgi:O-antigen/teichoic acid export membrane protein
MAIRNNVKTFLSLGRTAFAVASARLFSLLLFIVTARHFTPADNSLFIYAITMSQLLVQIGTLGWLSVIRREISRAEEANASTLKGFILRSFQVPMASIVFIALVFAAIAFFEVSETNFRIYLCISLITILYSILFILREYLAALGLPASSTFSAETIPFAATGIILLCIDNSSISWALVYFCLGISLGILLQVLLIGSRLRTFLAAPTSDYQTAHWSRVAAFALVGFGGRTLLDRMDTMVLPTLASSEDLAMYNSASRISGLLIIVPTVLLLVFSPRLSKAFASGSTHQLKRDMVLQTLLVGIGVLPLAAFLIAFPSFTMEVIFGTQYRAAGNLVNLIVFSQVVFAFSLPWSNLLLMSNGEKIYAFAHLIALMIAGAIAFGLADTLGAYSVALAATAANTLLFVVFFLTGLFRLAERAQ